jgi:hypothetical protein
MLQGGATGQVLQQPQDAAPVLADGPNGCHLVFRQQAPFDSDKALEVGDALHSAPEEGWEGVLLSIKGENGDVYQQGLLPHVRCRTVSQAIHNATNVCGVHCTAGGLRVPNHGMNQTTASNVGGAEVQSQEMTMKHSAACS